MAWNVGQLRKINVQKMSEVEMRMLWMTGNSLRDMTKNKCSHRK